MSSHVVSHHNKSYSILHLLNKALIVVFAFDVGYVTLSFSDNSDISSIQNVTMLEVTISDEDLLPTIVKGVGCLYAAGCTKGTETGLAGAADMILPAAAIKLKGITAGA